MNDFNNFGLKVLNVYQPCLKNENIFMDDKKRDEFSGKKQKTYLYVIVNIFFLVSSRTLYSYLILV